MRYYRTTSHSKYDLKVHIVFTPKYRKHALHGKIRESLRDYIRQTCEELELEIISGKICVDHVHLFISYPPTISISKILQRIKGKSSYKLYQKYPEVKKEFWGHHFWSRGYMSVSSGNITDEMIQSYIDEQEGENIQTLNPRIDFE